MTTPAPAPAAAAPQLLHAACSRRTLAPAIADAVRRDGGVEVEANGAEALQRAVEAIVAARELLAPDGREIAVSLAIVGPAVRLRVLRATLTAGQLHEVLRARLEDLVEGDDACLDAMADRLTASVLFGQQP